MSVTVLLNAVKSDTTGQETVLRIIGSREAPGRMVLQIAVKGTARVQIQARIARDAPWVNVGPVHAASALMHIDAVQFLRAVADQFTADSSVSVWAVWAW